MSILERLTCETADLGEENVKKLLALFPECACEQGQVDFDKLRQVLSSHVLEGDVERYQFTWPGKRAAMAEANRKTNKTFRPDREASVNFDTTENLYIEGDNLEALKLLQSTYANNVKMVYIDPPYNTGSDFIYRDDFRQSIDEYEENLGVHDENGNRMFKNTDTNGRFHSDWCSMIYSRLMLARNLLSEDGAIFISIDDNEVTNLTKICDEIFGVDNRIALICHKSRASVSNDKIISPNHNTILFYAKNILGLESKRKFIGLDPVLDGFDLDDNDGCGAYRLVPVDGPGGAKKGNPFYEFLGVEGYWRFSKETMLEKYNQGLVVRRGNSLYQKYFKTTAANTRRTATTWWDDAGLTSTATTKLKSLMGESSFDTPKPVELIDRMLRMITFQDKESIVLDFFSGSATTAHAVMQLNAEDGGKRKFILVQLPEVTDEKSEAYKAGYKNICEIGKERIRRAGKKIQEEHPLTTQQLDVGFRVLKIDSSSINDVSKPVNEMSQEEMNFESERIKADRSSEDLLFQVLLQTQIPLSEKIERETICGNEVFTVGGVMVACLDKQAKLTEAFFTALAERQPAMAFFRDDTFVDDSARTNLEQIFKQFSKDTKIKVL